MYCTLIGAGFGLGAVLGQVDEKGDEYVVAFASRSNNSAERNYSSYEGECLAAVWAVVHFRPYLYGREFKLVTDHQPLKWLMTNQKLTGKHARWALILSEYQMEIQHRAGLCHSNADGLSRNPVSSTIDRTGARQDGGDDGEVIPKWHVTAYLVWQELAAAALEPADIWEDAGTLGILQGKGYRPEASHAERDRIQQRAKRFTWRAGQLFWTAGTEEKWVPTPGERAGIIALYHEQLGHFGILRTYDMVKQQCWWRGMKKDVADWCRQCQPCSRVKAAFTSRQPVLHPLPIMGLFYRWSVDLAGDLPLSRNNKRYVVVMIEHFSKWVEVVAIPQKTAYWTREAFLQCVLSRFGACAEVVTDQGKEFHGEFHQLLEESLIDHRMTSREHPEADGLAERMVQTIKRALRKYCLTGHLRDWDLQLPYLALGYRVTRQSSLGKYSPYFLLFGRHPTLPGAIKEKTAEVVDLDNPDVWAQVVGERAALFERAMPMAMGNLRIAQHRDTLRYAKKRSGTYQPKSKKFQPGDFVYLRRQTKDTLDASTQPTILRVVEVRENGRLKLEGADGSTAMEHMHNCAPCHLPQINTSVQPDTISLGGPTDGDTCEEEP